MVPTFQVTEWQWGRPPRQFPVPTKLLPSHPAQLVVGLRPGETTQWVRSDGVVWELAAIDTPAERVLPLHDEIAELLAGLHALDAETHATAT